MGAGTPRRRYGVLVVDDSVLPRLAARTMLRDSTEFRLCGEAVSGEEAVQTVRSAKPELILMDVHMAGMGGPEATRTILAEHPDIKVIAWTVSESADDLLRMLRAGCIGYVLKDVGPNELQHALGAALKSENPLPRRMVSDVLRRVSDAVPLTESSGDSPALTSREMQVLRGIAKGHTSKRIAHDISLAVPSVETHLRNIYRKLNVTNRGEAVSTALKRGLISLGDL